MDKSKFYAALRKSNSGVFGKSISQRQVDGIEGLLDAFESHGDAKADTLAYALATAYHETGSRMVPVREGFASSDKSMRAAVNRLARKRGPNSAVAKYARPTGPYGHVYAGRGHVQLTWMDNYRRSSDDAGVDLVKHPDKMLDPEISARVLFKGLLDGRWNGAGKGLRHYLDRGDLKNARRTVNITDKWLTIANYHKAFLKAIEAAGGWEQRPDPVRPVPRPVVQPPVDHVPETPKPKPSGWAAFFAALFGKK